jgi:hypothetical protein
VQAKTSLAHFVGRYMRDEVAVVEGRHEPFLELRPFDVARHARTADGAPAFGSQCSAALAGDRCRHIERCASSHAPPRRWC